MAVFLINICKFNGCGITFPSLGDLIQHIEDTHIGTYDQLIVVNLLFTKPQIPIEQSHNIGNVQSKMVQLSQCTNHTEVIDFIMRSRDEVITQSETADCERLCLL